MAKVRMYYTGTCPYCQRAERLLKKRGMKKMELINVAANKKLWADMKKETKRNTVSQIFIDDYHVGGFDDLADPEVPWTAQVNLCIC